MLKFTSLFGFLASKLITHCLFSPALSSATNVTETLWRSFDGFSPADESSASPVPVRGQCALECQGRAGCQGFFYNDVSKRCVRVMSESDILSGPGVSGFRYYTNKCLVHAASSSCFTVHDTPLLHWEPARDRCNSTGGQLAVLDTRGKVDFIMNVMENNMSYTSERYHLGASRPMDKWNTPWPASGQDFVWLNGQPLDVAVADGHWWFNDPNNGDEKDNVIQLYRYPRHWIDGTADYDSKPVGHICQYSLV